MPHADPEVKRAYERRYYQENREKIKARAKQWREDNPERCREMHAQIRTRKREDIREYQRAWYERNRELVLERVRVNYQRRRELDPEKVMAMDRDRAARRRARQRKAFVETVDLQVVWERDEGICQICEKPADRGDWHLDHVVPIARGGEHSYANVQVTHPLCNWRKAAL